MSSVPEWNTVEIKFIITVTNIPEEEWEIAKVEK